MRKVKNTSAVNDCQLTLQCIIKILPGLPKSYGTATCPTTRYQGPFINARFGLFPRCHFGRPPVKKPVKKYQNCTWHLEVNLSFVFRLFEAKNVFDVCNVTLIRFVPRGPVRNVSCRSNFRDVYFVTWTIETSLFVISSFLHGKSLLLTARKPKLTKSCALQLTNDNDEWSEIGPGSIENVILLGCCWTSCLYRKNAR